MAFTRSLNQVPVGEFAEPPRFFGAEVKTDFKTKQPVEKDGKTVYSVTVIVGTNIFKVSVPLADEPVVAPLTPLKFKGLVVGVYNDKFYFKADDVDVV